MTPPSAGRVSVVMAAYNAGSFIRTTIESVVGQTYSDWELLVIDDGSTDDTGRIVEAVASREPRVRVVHQANGGISVARNRGLAEVAPGAAFVGFLDSDDAWVPDGLATLVAALVANPDASAAHGLMRYMDDHGNDRQLNGQAIWPSLRRCVDGHRLRRCSTEPTTFEVLAYRNCIPTSGLLMRGATARAVGTFDPGLELAEDWDFWLRVSLQGPVTFVPKVVSRYRLHPDNASKSLREMEHQHHRVRVKWLHVPLSPERRRCFVRGWRFDLMATALRKLRSSLRATRKSRFSKALSELRVAVLHVAELAQTVSHPR